MKKLIRWALCLVLCLGLVVCGALAAEESAITVQLDGAPLTFTDAVPQVKDQRTFLPFRAVFEAMGAEVSNEGNVITAVRGDKTLTMTVGSAEASVEANGVTTPITMDVAPYVDASTWRTYVPVRFAAQAFDCAVGWDGTANTAVIVDTEKLVTGAKAGKTYTYLEQIANLGQKYNEGIWNTDATFDMEMAADGTSLMTMDGFLKGVSQDNAKMDMTMNMKMDLTGLVESVSLLTDGQASFTVEDQAMLDDLKTNGIDATIRGDMNTGKLYMNMDMGALSASAGVDANTWYEMDMAALLAQSGMDWEQLMAMSENADLMDALTSSFAATQPNDAANGYAQLKQTFDELFGAFADDKFVKKGNDYVLEYTLPQAGNLTLTVTMNGDTLTGYAMGMTLAASDTVNGSDAAITMTMDVAMTADGKMNAEVNMDLGGTIALTLTMDGSYTAGTTAPVVTPPAGATIVPFTDMMGQSGDLGVIGGADGPTAVTTTTW